MDKLSIARSTLYRLLSLGFGYPTADIFESFKSGEFIAALADTIASLPYLKSLEPEQAQLAMIAENDLGRVSFSDFEVNFVQTFEAGSPQPPCPPYEGFYRKVEVHTAVMLEVSEFYTHFGLAMSQESGKREIPDHLRAELEFLHFLTFKEAQTSDNGNPELLKGYLQAQKDFLERHLVQWVPKFYEALKKSPCFPFYVQLARITSLFIAHDFEWVAAYLRNFKVAQNSF